MCSQQDREVDQGRRDEFDEVRGQEGDYEMADRGRGSIEGSNVGGQNRMGRGEAFQQFAIP